MKNLGILLGIALLIIIGVVAINQESNSSDSSSSDQNNASDSSATLGKAASSQLVENDARHIYGDTEAPITITVFSDFECPYCAKAAPIIEKIVDDNPGKVRFVFRNFPLSYHEDALLAAEAAEAAGAQNKEKFWEMHDKAFANQSKLSRTDLIGYATAIGLNIEQFTSDIDSSKYKDLIEKDQKDGEALNVMGTPTIYLNNKLVNFSTFSDFEALVQQEIDKL